MRRDGGGLVDRCGLASQSVVWEEVGRVAGQI